MAKILVTDDEAGIREFLADTLELDDHEVDQASGGEAAIALLNQNSYHLLLTDLKMPGIDGMELLRWARRERATLPVIVLTAHGTVEHAVEAMKLGAFDFLQKPISGPEELQALVTRAVERDAPSKVAPVVSGRSTGPALSYGDPAMKPVVEALGKVAKTSATVLLLGESGAGKEVAARWIHDNSSRASGAFAALNCAALTENLLESELFGHEKGAFTGADQAKAGQIETAAGGTFFLDEVGELKQELQAKLLRVLQEKTFQRVGGTQSLQADVRWLAATNRDLLAMVKEGRFREDLYHRLAVFPVVLPALRERPADILPIAGELLQRIAAGEKRAPWTLSESAEAKLMSYHWPGNVRELRNALERAGILADTGVIEEDNLWLEINAAPGKCGPDTQAVRHLLEIEKEAIGRALDSVAGNRRKAAELLGIGERTLYDKIKKYAL